MSEKRRALPVDTETEVLVRSRRRCALCYGVDRNFDEQLGQIAHIDKNRANNSLDNLAWLCLKHHSLYDSTTSQHKNYRPKEVKAYRKKLYDAIANSEITGEESMGRYFATQDTAYVINLSDRIIVRFDWPLRCAPTLSLRPSSLTVGIDADIAHISSRGFELSLRTPINTASFAFFADAAPKEYATKASEQYQEWLAGLDQKI